MFTTARQLSLSGARLAQKVITHPKKVQVTIVAVQTMEVENVHLQSILSSALGVGGQVHCPAPVHPGRNPGTD